MDDVKKSGDGDENPEILDESKEGFWNEAKARSRVAGQRAGEEWGRLSEQAKDYADEHAIGVALGSLGVGIARGSAGPTHLPRSGQARTIRIAMRVRPARRRAERTLWYAPPAGRAGRTHLSTRLAAPRGLCV